jgi:pantoate--beta-alanine ligase
MYLHLLGLGSNLGDRVGNLLRAASELRRLRGTTLQKVSSFVETRPVGGPEGQANFFNGAAILESPLAPAELLASLQAMENSLGRERQERWGPRTIDLDLLLVRNPDGQDCFESWGLTVPHPRMHERRFVLEPAAEIAPDWVHGGKKATVQQLLDQLPAAEPGEIGIRVMTSAIDMQSTAQTWRNVGKKVGLIPTMGALHEGHLSLVRTARAKSDIVVATIFVNPTQFGPNEDFSKYPRTLDADLQVLAAAGCDWVFVPERESMYPPGASTMIEPPAVAQPLEGVCRPGHFRGVATIVLKLLNLIPATAAYFGQKDYQQVCVIQHMIRDLNVPIEIIVCPTVREADGLAMSSRNRYLSPVERQQAVALSQALNEAHRLVKDGERDAAKVGAAMRNILSSAGIERVDYATVAHAESLGEVDQIAGPTVALIACFVGTTRLIDNRRLT